jgi:hypothetical protein
LIGHARPTAAWRWVVTALAGFVVHAFADRPAAPARRRLIDPWPIDTPRRPADRARTTGGGRRGGAGCPRLRFPRAALIDFADPAALLSCLDPVIRVDTAAAHRAGALGLPVRVGLPYSPDCRWMLGRDDSPWYPSMRLPCPLAGRPARGHGSR